MDCMTVYSCACFCQAPPQMKDVTSYTTSATLSQSTDFAMQVPRIAAVLDALETSNIGGSCFESLVRSLWWRHAGYAGCTVSSVTWQ